MTTNPPSFAAMSRATLFASLVVFTISLAMPGPAGARPLGGQGARNMVFTALAESTTSWRYSAGNRRLACRRMSPRSFRCTVSWYIGDAGYRGRVRARRVDGRRTVVGFVIETDDYCRYVTMDGDCTRRLRVRWHG